MCLRLTRRNLHIHLSLKHHGSTSGDCREPDTVSEAIRYEQSEKHNGWASSFPSPLGVATCDTTWDVTVGMMDRLLTPICEGTSASIWKWSVMNNRLNNWGAKRGSFRQEIKYLPRMDCPVTSPKEGLAVFPETPVTTRAYLINIVPSS